MIASRLGLTIAAALALLLAVVLLVTRAPPRESADRALVPGFDPATVTELAWGPLRVARDPKSATGWVLDEAVPANATAIEDALAALRGARWHRRASLAAAGPLASTLALKPPLTVRIGAPLGTEQQWLAIADRAFLVDAWVARALVPDPLALRVRRPFAAAASARTIRIEPVAGPALAIAGDRLLEPIALAASQPLLSRLRAGLEQLEVAALPTTAAGPRGTTLRVDATIVIERGACTGGRIQIEGTFGRGCIEGAAWDELQAAVAALRAPPEAIVEPRLAASEATRLQLVDHAILDLSKRPRIGDRDADPDRVLELLAALAAEAKPVALPKGKPLGSLTITAGAETVLDLFAGTIVARHGEPVALALDPARYAVLTRPGGVYRDPALWHEEPTTIRKLSIGASIYIRGATLGEWTRDTNSAADAAVIDRLVAALAAPRIVGDAAKRPARQVITIEVAPPGGAPRTREVGLVGLVPAGCHAIIDGETVVIAREVCELAAKLR